MRPESNIYRLLSLIFPAVLLAFMTAGCDVHEFPDDVEPEPPVAHSRVILDFVDLDMPLYTTIDITPAESRQASQLYSRHIIKVYPADGASTASRDEIASVTILDTPGNITLRREVDINLSPGTYRYIAWSDYSIDGGNTYYDPASFAEISLISTERGGLHYHATDTPEREAFRGEGTFTVGADGLMYNPDGTRQLDEAIIEMRRPLARFQFITNDLDRFVTSSRFHQNDGSRDAASAEAINPLPSINPSSYRILFRYAGYMPCAFNNFTNKPVDAITSAAFTGAITPLPDTPAEASLGADYVFTNGSETSVLIVLDIFDADTGERIASTDVISVPVKRNHLTIVKGPFLTCGTGSNIGVNPGFDGDINIEIR